MKVSELIPVILMGLSSTSVEVEEAASTPAGFLGWTLEELKEAGARSIGVGWGDGYEDKRSATILFLDEPKPAFPNEPANQRESRHLELGGYPVIFTTYIAPDSKVVGIVSVVYTITMKPLPSWVFEHRYFLEIVLGLSGAHEKYAFLIGDLPRLDG